MVRKKNLKGIFGNYYLTEFDLYIDIVLILYKDFYLFFQWLIGKDIKRWHAQGDITNNNVLYWIS